VETSLAVFTEKVSSLESLAAGDTRERILQILNLTRDSAPGQNFAGAALILLDLGMDADTVIAAMLLAVFRDSLLPNEIAEKVGPESALLVQGVKKIDDLKTNVKTSYEAENVRNMLFALTGDIRVILIRLAEKLHDMRVLDSSPDDEGRKVAARECLDIYAPLANRLGVSWIKDEMEDLSLKFLSRETYRQIKNIIAQKREQRSLFLELAREAIIGEAKKAGLTIEVKSRAKHFYSVYMKMRKRGKTADEIRDLSA